LRGTGTTPSPVLNPAVRATFVPAIFNDFDGNTEDIAYVYYGKPFFVLTNGKLELRNRPAPKANLLVRATAGLARRSFLLMQLGRAAQALMRGARNRSPAQASSLVRQADPRAELLTAIVEEFGRRVREAGASYVVAFVGPRGSRLSRTLSLQPDDAIMGLAGHVNDSLYRIPGDVHWNADGHFIVADALIPTHRKYGVNCRASR
jgi:hypothetical protein